MTEAIDVLLRDHAGVHARAADFLAALDERALRAHLAGLNSVAWILWHMARVEDGCLASGVFATEQVLDGDGWGRRLGVAGHGNGFGMRRAEAAGVSQALDLDALHACREAIGRRTRELAAGLRSARWSEPLTEADVQRMAADGVCRAPAGEPREALLHWRGLHHNHWHLGRCAAIRGPLAAQGQGPAAGGGARVGPAADLLVLLVTRAEPGTSHRRSKGLAAVARRPGRGGGTRCMDAVVRRGLGAAAPGRPARPGRTDR